MENKTTRVLFITDDAELRKVLEFCFDGWGFDVFFMDSSKPDLGRIIKILPDVIVVDVHAATKGELEICNVLKDDFVTAYIPVITLIDKKRLRHHLLELRQGVDDYLIKPPDPLDLRVRVEMVIKRSKQNLYASPLTGLPGGIIIEDVIRERIESTRSFVLGHVDIDNFKSYNDRYGYTKGDRVIMQTAYMLSTSVRSWGTKGDFVGHIGGDDFVFVTTPEKYREVCQNFICMFDTVIPFHYSREERDQRYIMASDRRGKTMKVPLMSVTIALILKNSSDEFTNMIEVNERVTEVKSYLKKIPGSKYMADRRIKKRDDTLKLEVFSNDESLVKGYRPLGEILVEKHIINAEQLDKALRIHWKRGSFLGEVMKEEGMVTEKQLEEALSCQQGNLGV